MITPQDFLRYLKISKGAAESVAIIAKDGQVYTLDQLIGCYEATAKVEMQRQLYEAFKRAVVVREKTQDYNLRIRSASLIQAYEFSLKVLGQSEQQIEVARQVAINSIQ